MAGAGEEDLSKLDLLMSQLRLDGEDAAAQFGAMCRKFTYSLGPAADVRTVGRGRRRSDELCVTLGDQVFVAALQQGRLECSRRLVVRGIGLSSSPLSLSAWLDELLAELSGAVERSEAARTALDRLLA